MTKIKLCGLSRDQDIFYANRLMPDYAGFVFCEKSSRSVTRRQAFLLREKLHPSIKAVGVFVDETEETIRSLTVAGIIQLIQLHGGETEEEIRRLREILDPQVKIIRAFRTDSAEDVVKAQKSAADLVLVDHGPGGTGQRFDWKLLAPLNRPFILAGGLHAGNAAEAVRTLKPYAVDVSSGIETDGKKDFEKMEAFCRAVRTADMTGL
ncbi:MAG TPA: phosphoribosylanthranilate isomerase, partial [Lachnospiraceae bacterium]|nr:phosphoribosylanthranilate isomerase [Lachnospiraceae bacterium]